MKKIIPVVFSLIILINKSYSQNVWPCTPDVNLTYNGISPGTLPPAMAGYEYWSTLSFKIPKDSAIGAGSSTIAITIDSAKFLYATGKPAGFTFYCDKPSCTWAGGTKGCALFYGKADSTLTDSFAEYPMKIYTMTWYRFTGGADQFSRIDSATNYRFRINRYNSIGEISRYQNLTAYPNPTTGKINIELRDLAKNNSKLKIMDTYGKLIYEATITENNQFVSTLTIDLSEYKTGLYFITVKSGDRVGLTKVLLR